MRSHWVPTVVVLGLSLSAAVLWGLRERERRVLGAPPAVVVSAGVARRADATTFDRPVLDFEDAVWPREHDSVHQARQTGATPRSVSREVQVERVPPITSEDVLAALREGDRDALRALRERLLADGNASLDLIEALLEAGVWRAEHFAMSMLHGMATPEARIIAIGHMLTRPVANARGWHRLARRVGHMMDGDSVDLIVGMLGEAEGHTQRRLLALLQHARSEDALFRLYMVGDEHADEHIRQVAINTVFRGRRPGSMTLLQDIMLTHENPEVSAMAAVGLAEAGWGPAVQFLAQTANGSDRGAEVARWALEQAQRPQSHRSLAQIAGDAGYSTEVRLAAVRALGASRSRRRTTTQYLEQLAGDSDSSSVREAAAGFFEERAQ